MVRGTLGRHRVGAHGRRQADYPVRRPHCLAAIARGTSYPASARHAFDELLLARLTRQALRLMAALFWDLGENPPPAVHQ
jgi:hypothetical protein